MWEASVLLLPQLSHIMHKIMNPLRLCKSAFRVCACVEGGQGEGKTSQERVWNPKDKIKRIQAQIVKGSVSALLGGHRALCEYTLI